MPDDLSHIDITKRLKVDEVLLEQDYTWENLMEVEEDIFQALDSMPGEFTGTIKVKVTRCER